MRIIQLALPTSHVHQGPTVSWVNRQLIIRYDSDVNGATDWAEMHFDDTLTFRYRDFSVCSDEDILGHDYIVEETDSAELVLLQERRSRFLGGNQYELRRDSASPVRLYRLYFDDVAAIEVVARSVKILL